MLNINNNPNMIARIPTITLNAENPDNKDAIPKNTKLTPISMETNPVLITGKIIKINPKIMDNIVPCFFLLKIVLLTFSSEKC